MSEFGKRQHIKLRWRMQLALRTGALRWIASDAIYWTTLAILALLAALTTAAGSSWFPF